MLRIHELKPSFIWFYAFGLTTYIPLKEPKTKPLLFLSFFVNLALFIAFLGQIFAFASHSYPQLTRNIVLNTALSYSAVLIFISNFLTVLFNVFNPLKSRKILLRFATIIEYMEMRLSIPIFLCEFERKYRYKMLLFILFESASLLPKLFINSTFHVPINILILEILLIYKIMLIFHITIYICLVETLLIALNSKIKELSHRSIGRHSILFMLRQFKWVHFKLSKNIKNLNDYFGWIVFSLMMESFILTTISIAFAFVYAETNVISIIRKYFKNLFKDTIAKFFFWFFFRLTSSLLVVEGIFNPQLDISHSECIINLRS